MLFHRRRMNNVQYVLLGVLFGSSVYLWTTKKPIYDHQQNLIQVNAYEIAGPILTSKSIS